MGFFDLFKKKSKQKKIQDSKSNVNNNLSVRSQLITEEVIPVEKRIKKISPNSEGLYPHEVLVLSYAPTYYVDGDNEFQRFWWYRYGIKDVNKVLKSLLNRDFLRSGSLASAMQKATVVELKDILRDNDRKVTGNKKVLIQRLLDEVDNEKLNKIFKRRTYEVTDLGEKVLNYEEHIPYIHKNSIENLDIFSLSKMIENKPNYPYRDIIWGYLNKNSMKHFENRDFGLYRNCRFTMSEFIKEERKIETSFALLVEVIMHDLSGLSNNFNMDFLYIYKDGYFPHENSLISIPPGILSRVVEYKETKGFTDDELRQKIVEIADKISLPLRIFTVDECADIVIMEINNQDEELIKIYDRAEKRFNKKFRFS